MLIWLPDSPVHARFLTKEERIAALERVRNDQGGTANRHFKKEQVKIMSVCLIISNIFNMALFKGLGSPY